MNKKEIIQFIENKIEHYLQVTKKNDEEYIKIDDFALGITRKKMTKLQKKKGLNRQLEHHLQS